TDSWKAGEYNWSKLPKWGRYSWFREWLDTYRVRDTAIEPEGEEEQPGGKPDNISEPSKPVSVAPESEVYLQAVRDWRNYWRPEKVRYLLIAESHVHEKEGDSRAEVISLHQYGLQDHPSSFCRLIYCLGYGELELLNRPVRTNYRGTPQFWDIFGALSCCDVDHPESRQPRKGQSDLTERVRWKIKTLEALKEKGIWLIDACPKGLYVPGDDRQMISDAEFKRLFVEEVLPGIDTENLRSSWIIGKTVHDKIADVTPSLKGYIYQPQGWRRSQREYRKHLQPMIDDICDETNEDISDTSGEVEERDRSGTEYGSPLQGYE
ncbi:MAG: hypothetical protein HN738_07985, partial [Gammaproteobacteria bacterium]|nr:hypothetical protein [Gammaproteobacteria bacterium]